MLAEREGFEPSIRRRISALRCCPFFRRFWLTKSRTVARVPKQSAEKGFFVTTNKFTLMAEKTAEGNPRLELTMA